MLLSGIHVVRLFGLRIANTASIDWDLTCLNYRKDWQNCGDKSKWNEWSESDEVENKHSSLSSNEVLGARVLLNHDG